jgi:hypothetical protein
MRGRDAYHSVRTPAGRAIRTARCERAHAGDGRAYLRGQLTGSRGIAP